MSLQGVLSDFGAAEVFQLIAQQRKTGILEIERGERVLEVYFREGLVLRARPAEAVPSEALCDLLLRTGLISAPVLEGARQRQAESLEPLPKILIESCNVRGEDVDRIARLVSHETIFELFLRDEGRFRFVSRDVEDEQGDEGLGAEQVLLDALRMRDEWSDVEQALPDRSLVLQRSVDIEELRVRRAAIALEAGLPEEDLERLFRLSDGRLEAQRVIDLSRLGTFAGAKGLVGLRRAGMLRAEARPRPPAEPALDPAAPPRARAAGAGIVALAVGGGVLALLLWWQPAPRDPAIPAADLAQGRAEARREERRLEAEAARWAAPASPAPRAGVAPAADGYITPPAPPTDPPR
jgi:hypothetical protein